MNISQEQLSAIVQATVSARLAKEQYLAAQKVLTEAQAVAEKARVEFDAAFDAMLAARDSIG